MGIDYRCCFGIGYEVEKNDEIIESEEVEDGLEDYLYCEAGEGFISFGVNNGYDTETESVFLIVDNPFEDGLDMEDVKKRLDSEIKRLRLEPVGEFGLVGGMYVF